MPELVCAYSYGTVIDATNPYWILDRWEGGRVVARGAAGHPACLRAIAAFQGPREMPPSRGELPRVEVGVIEPVDEHGNTTRDSVPSFEWRSVKTSHG